MQVLLLAVLGATLQAADAFPVTADNVNGPPWEAHWLNASRRGAPFGSKLTTTLNRWDCGHYEQAFYVVNEKEKYVGCFTAKNGCTSWLKYLRHSEGTRTGQAMEAERLNMQTKVHQHLDSEPLGLRFIGCDSPHFGRHVEMLQDPSFFKFTVARHPFDRLYSGYNSIARPCCEEAATANQASADLPPESCCAISESVEPRDFSFSYFLQGLHERSASSVNPHFKSVARGCMHHKISWDFVGETDGQGDTDYISRHLGFPQTFREYTRPQANPWHSRQRQQPEGVSKYLRTVNLTEADTVHLQSFLAEDMSTLGYSWDGL